MSDIDIDSTKIYLPKSLPYPLTILKIHVKEGVEINKYSPIITYKYYDYEPIPISEQDDEQTDENERKLKKVENVGTFDSTISGKVSKINVSVNDEILDSNKLIIEIIEPCTHPIQYGGLCAVCGKSIDENDGEDKRAPISMAHDTTNLKVSSKEAENIERSSTDRLLNEEKLSLVVDLDQTVIHVTVDPTVAEWMSDPTNPNYEALKDVRSFILEEPAMIPLGYKGPIPPPIKRWYYVKLRPGLSDFLAKMSKKYEMHIYTMATRQYAKSIAKIIDPDGVYFGERILSRDESGSITQKSLKRLFPVDTSMVVVIDDRGDVWNWSPNLIKVVPYDFFLGIGDINSSFLPRQQMLLGPSKRRKSVSILEDQIIHEDEIEKIENLKGKDENKKDIKFIENNEEIKKIDNNNPNNKNQESDLTISTDSSSPVDRLIELGAGEDNSTLLAVQENERTNVLEQQEHDRPLAKLQQNLDKIIEEEEEGAAITTDKNLKINKVNKIYDNNKNDSNKDENEKSKKRIMEFKESHNLLYDDDKELEYLGLALIRIHNEFYFEVDEAKQQHNKKLMPDVKNIMKEMKSLVFDGCVFLLSGVLPLGTKLNNADIVIWAKSFGAKFVEDYETKVTHVICKNGGTFKVRLAKSVDKNVKIVNPDWIFACISLWDRISEAAYEVKVDGLLSKAQVDDFLQFHSNKQSTVNLKAFNWGEIDEEMKDFMGSDYEDEDDEDDEGDEEDELTTGKSNSNTNNETIKSSVNIKHSLEDNGKEARENKRIKVEEKDEEKEYDTNAESDDEFERDLLEHLADLE